MADLIDRGTVLDFLDLAEHDAEERDWRSGANEIARIRKAIAALPAQGVSVKPLTIRRGTSNAPWDDGWTLSIHDNFVCYKDGVNAMTYPLEAGLRAWAEDRAALSPAEAGGVEATNMQKVHNAPAPVDALVKAAAQDAREVFEDYGSKAREAIDYMEQVALAAIREGGDD